VYVRTHDYIVSCNATTKMFDIKSHNGWRFQSCDFSGYLRHLKRLVVMNVGELMAISICSQGVFHKTDVYLCKYPSWPSDPLPHVKSVQPLTMHAVSACREKKTQSKAAEEIDECSKYSMKNIFIMVKSFV
jgi:hypothetical protein